MNAVAEENREIGAWLLEQLAPDEQGARALPTALGGPLSRWSPNKLVAVQLGNELYGLLTVRWQLVRRAGVFPAEVAHGQVAVRLGEGQDVRLSTGMVAAGRGEVVKR